MKNLSKENKKLQDPLFLAIRDGRTYDVIQMLRGCNENPDSEKRNFSGSSVLHLAVNFGHITLVKHFVNIGKNVNDIDYFQQTPLHRACIKVHITKNTKILNFLLSLNNIEINIRDVYGKLPIHYLISDFDLFMNFYDSKKSLMTLNLKDQCFQPLLLSLKFPTNDFCKNLSSLLYQELNINVVNNENETFKLLNCSCAANTICPILSYFQKMLLLNYSIESKIFENRPTFEHLIKEQNIFFQNEIREMKEWLINFQTGENLYDFLKFKRAKSIRYSTNLILMSIYNFCKGDFQNGFPHFGQFLTKRFEKMLLRKKIIDKFLQFMKICSSIDIPEYILYNITKYLTDQELFEFNVFNLDKFKISEKNSFQRIILDNKKKN